jgi:predicted transcriptional regulator
MSEPSGFHDLLFEVSNENRYIILVFLRQKAMRITDITRKIGLTTPEARRHVSRLGEVGLIQRDVEGFYHITPYGEGILILLTEFDFMAQHNEYFQSHTLTKIPTVFLKRVGELIESRNIENAMDFLRHTESLFKEANEHVWLLLDQFPLNSLSTIMEAIERGVQFKIIEPLDRVLSPDIDSMTSEETQALSRARHTPMFEHKMLDTVNVFLYLSESKCVLAFPTSDGQYDYSGFASSDDSSLEWCRELFQHYWDEGIQRTSTRLGERGDHERVSERDVRERIIIEGRNDPNIDTLAIQDAVDNFNEVILRGRFILGEAALRAAPSGLTTIKIRRSVVIRGDGREDNIPATKIAKSNWKFPFLDINYLFEVRWRRH